MSEVAKRKVGRPKLMFLEDPERFGVVLCEVARRVWRCGPFEAARFAGLLLTDHPVDTASAAETAVRVVSGKLATNSLADSRAAALARKLRQLELTAAEANWFLTSADMLTTLLATPRDWAALMRQAAHEQAISWLLDAGWKDQLLKLAKFYGALSTSNLPPAEDDPGTAARALIARVHCQR